MPEAFGFGCKVKVNDDGSFEIKCNFDGNDFEFFLKKIKAIHGKDVVNVVVASLIGVLEELKTNAMLLKYQII